MRHGTGRGHRPDTVSDRVTPVSTASATPRSTPAATSTPAVTSTPAPTNIATTVSVASGTSLARVDGVAGTDLVLVGPSGGTQVVRSWPMAGDEDLAAILDWAPDGRRVLVQTFRRSDERASLALVDLVTGSETSLPVSGEVSFLAATFTRPTGANLVVAQGDQDRRVLDRRDAAGNLLAPIAQVAGLSYLAPSRWWLYLPDGTGVLVAGEHGIDLHRNDGTLLRALPVTDAGPCWPVRWWASGTALVACVEPHGEATTWQRLWTVPLDGDAPAALTPAGTDDLQVVDFGYADARQVAGRTFVQWTGDCGAASVEERTAGGLQPVQVDLADGLYVNSVYLQGAAGDRLVLLVTAGCGGEGGRLVTTDLGGGDVRPLLEAPDDMHGTSGALVWPVS